MTDHQHAADALTSLPTVDAPPDVDATGIPQGTMLSSHDPAGDDPSLIRIIGPRPYAEVTYAGSSDDGYSVVVTADRLVVVDGDPAGPQVLAGIGPAAPYVLVHPNRLEQAYLGIATTEDLIRELAARLDNEPASAARDLHRCCTEALAHAGAAVLTRRTVDDVR